VGHQHDGARAVLGNQLLECLVGAGGDRSQRLDPGRGVDAAVAGFDGRPAGRAYCRRNCNAGSVLDGEAEIADALTEKVLQAYFGIDDVRLREKGSTAKIRKVADSVAGFSSKARQGI
jgi:hypothetical protein